MNIAPSFELTPELTALEPERGAPSSQASRRLWAAIHLPRLPLEALGPEGDPHRPLVVVEKRGARSRVLMLNESARVAGIRIGMRASTAATLAPELLCIEPDPIAERAALEALAAWSGRFTSSVSIAPPETVLLEVGGSQRLFGGLSALLQALRMGLGKLGYTVSLGVAPTPTAASLLARSGLGGVVTEIRFLAGSLARVPVEAMGFPRAVCQRLQEMGIRSFGDCCRLPRGGVARRLGPEVLERLDRALGRRQEIPVPHRAPWRFERQLMLIGGTRDREVLLRGMGRLLGELAGVLWSRGEGARRLEVHLAHHAGPSTRIGVELVRPSADAGHLLALIRARLERLELPAEVEGLGLRVPGAESISRGGCAGLFPEARAAREEMATLVERLRARLGEDHVRCVCPIPDHRPERSWQAQPPWASPRMPVAMDGGCPGVAGRGVRPVWLLARPRPLRVVSGTVWWQGPLGLASAAERIESGWWDGEDVVRDYFVAQGAGGQRVWIYRDLRRDGRWFLHGVFA